MKKIILSLLLLCVLLFVRAQSPTVGSARVSFRSCEPTFATLDIALLPGEMWQGYSFKKSGAYVRCLTNQRGCDSLVTLNVELMEGALPGKFSVDDKGTQVYFSKGNLQFLATKNGVWGDTTHIVKGNEEKNGVWRFAQHQYDMFGGGGKNCTSAQSSIATDWVDYFGFGAGGNIVEPYLTSSNNSDYINVDIANTDNDWGVYNAIENGGNTPNKWRLLTSEEWTYIYSNRPRAANLYGFALIGDIQGLILLPDDWLPIEGIEFSPGVAWYTQNIYSFEQWNIMENAGAVFLPAAGSRDAGLGGRYWSSTISSTANQAYVFRWNHTTSGNSNAIEWKGIMSFAVYAGYCVRLVKTVK